MPDSDFSDVELEAEEELMVNVFKERFRAQMESRMRLEELSKGMGREEEKMSLALRQFVRFRQKTQQSWQVEKTLLETKVMELENSILSEQEEREKSTRLMREFKRDGGDVIKKLRESLHTVTDKYRQEVNNSIEIAETLHTVQSKYECLLERTGDAVSSGLDEGHNMMMHDDMIRERRLHQTECEALEMKLQELSLVSEEDVKANEQLRQMLHRANADKEMLQNELAAAQSKASGSKPSQAAQAPNSDEMHKMLSEIGASEGLPHSLEEANSLIHVMLQHLQTERDMRLQTEEQTAVMQEQFENSMGLLENQNKDLANKLQQQKGGQPQQPRGDGARGMVGISPRGGRAGPTLVPSRSQPTMVPSRSQPGRSQSVHVRTAVPIHRGPTQVQNDGGNDVDLAELKEEMMRTITSIQKSLDNEGTS